LFCVVILPFALLDKFKVAEDHQPGRGNFLFLKKEGLPVMEVNVSAVYFSPQSTVDVNWII
jgi:hypothetical protein